MDLRLAVVALLVLLPAAQANSLHFDDPAGDQAPFPSYLDILAVDFRDDGEVLTVTVAMAEAPPGSPSTVFDILFESPTQAHNIGCFLGSTSPVEGSPGANCFAYRHAKGDPLAKITDYRGLHFEQDRDNRTLAWSFPLDTMAEEPGTELRLVRVLARLGVSDDRGGDIAAGDPQDIATTADAYVMPGPSTASAPPTVAGETALPPSEGKQAPGLGAAGLALVAALAAGARRRAP